MPPPKKLINDKWRGSSMPKSLIGSEWKGSFMSKSLGARGSSAITQVNPNTAGRNTSSGLPKVSGGMQPHPSHINNLSAAVDKTTVRSFVGNLVKQTNGGTTISPLPPRSDHPWKVSVVGDYLQIKTGLCHSGFSQVGIQQYYPSNTTAKNLSRGGELFLPAGCKSGQDGTTDLYTTGDDKAGTILLPKGDTTNGKYLFVYNGSLRFEETTWGAKAVIAWVKGNNVLQFINGDIWELAPRPLQVAVSSKDNAHYVKVSAGTVTNVVPTLGGKPLTDPTAELAISATTGIWLKCQVNEGGGDFPQFVTIIAQATNPANTNSFGYLKIADIIFFEGKPSVFYNYLNGSIYAEAHEFEPNKISYFFYSV